MAHISVHDANYLRRTVLSHKQKVLALYKKVIRDVESTYMPDRCEYRYQAVLMRQRFDQNKDIKDLRVAKLLLEKGEEEYEKNRNPQPLKFMYSPEGIGYNRYGTCPDWVFDYWHPLEKAQYPYFFARREQRKLEYLKLYEEEYGNAEKNLGIQEKKDYIKMIEELKEKKLESE